MPNKQVLNLNDQKVTKRIKEWVGICSDQMLLIFNKQFKILNFAALPGIETFYVIFSSTSMGCFKDRTGLHLLTKYSFQYGVVRRQGMRRKNRRPEAGMDYSWPDVQSEGNQNMQESNLYQQ